jgi:hypothetical protein
MNMKISNTLFSAIIGSVMALSSSAFAQTSSHTAEYDLVSNVRAIAATATSADQVQSDYQAALSAYNQAAVKDNAQDARFVQALVDNHVYTQVQAQALFSSAMDSSTEGLNANSSDVIATQMARLASVQLRGGQFSACGFTGGTVLVAGIAAVIYAAVLGHNTSCSTYSGYGSSTTSCTTSSSNNNKDLSRDLYIGGAIGIGAGVILLVAAGAGC